MELEATIAFSTDLALAHSSAVRDCPPNGVSGLTRRRLLAGRLVTDDRDNHGHERDAQGCEEEDVIVDGVSP